MKRVVSGRVWLAICTVYVVWGSTYLAIRWAVRTMPAFMSAGVRFVLAAGLLALVSRLRGGRGAWRLDAVQWRNAAICGVLMLAGGNGLVVVAETRVPSGLAALLVAAVPLWLIVLRRVLGDRTPALTLVGVLVGLGGLALLLLPGSAGSHVDFGYSLLLVAAALSWAAGSVLVTRVQLPDDPAVLSSVEMFAGGVVLLVAAAGGGEFSKLDLGAISVQSWLSLAYLVVFGSIVAFSAYVYALGNAPMSLVGTYAYVNPVVAVALGVLLAGEHLSVTEVLGGLIIVASVVVVVSAEGRKRRTVAPPEVAVDERAAA